METRHTMVPVKFNARCHRATEHLRSKLYQHLFAIAPIDVGICYFWAYLQCASIHFVLFIYCCMIFPPYPTPIPFEAPLLQKTISDAFEEMWSMRKCKNFSCRIAWLQEEVPAVI